MRTKKPNKFKMRFLGKRRSAEKGSTGESTAEETKDYEEDNTARLEPEPEREPEPEPEPEDVKDTIPELELADQSFFRNDFEQAIELYATSLALCIDKLGDMASVVGDIHVKIATIHQEKGRLEKALDHLTQAKEVYCNNVTLCGGSGEDSKISRNDSSELKWIEIITNIANIYIDLCQADKAHDTYVEALEISRKYLPKDDPRIGISMSNYANFLSICRGDHDKALETFKEVRSCLLSRTLTIFLVRLILLFTYFHPRLSECSAKIQWEKLIYKRQVL
mmetsp:Transcript_6535/g.7590  ORF Transcript_6535/g.7590 Transcript_6535/m.7590 type:complete len:279 (+) Transcript_6535:101-937(+)